MQIIQNLIQTALGPVLAELSEVRRQLALVSDVPANPGTGKEPRSAIRQPSESLTTDIPLPHATEIANNFEPLSLEPTNKPDPAIKPHFGPAEASIVASDSDYDPEGVARNDTGCDLPSWRYGTDHPDTDEDAPGSTSGEESSEDEYRAIQQRTKYQRIKRYHRAMKIDQRHTAPEDLMVAKRASEDSGILQIPAARSTIMLQSNVTRGPIVIDLDDEDDTSDEQDLVQATGNTASTAIVYRDLSEAASSALVSEPNPHQNTVNEDEPASDAESDISLSTVARTQRWLRRSTRVQCQPQDSFDTEHESPIPEEEFGRNGQSRKRKRRSPIVVESDDEDIDPAPKTVETLKTVKSADSAAVAVIEDTNLPSINIPSVDVQDPSSPDLTTAYRKLYGRALHFVHHRDLWNSLSPAKQDILTYKGALDILEDICVSRHAFYRFFPYLRNNTVVVFDSENGKWKKLFCGFCQSNMYRRYNYSPLEPLEGIVGLKHHLKTCQAYGQAPPSDMQELARLIRSHCMVDVPTPDGVYKLHTGEARRAYIWKGKPVEEAHENLED